MVYPQNSTEGLIQIAGRVSKVDRFHGDFRKVMSVDVDGGIEEWFSRFLRLSRQEQPRLLLHDHISQSIS